MTGLGARGAAPGAGAPGVGLALVIREGLPAWLAALERLLTAAPTPASGAGGAGPAPDATTPARTIAAEVLPPAQQPDVTRVLVALVLSTRRAAPHEASHLRSPGPSPALAREGASR